VFLKPQLHPIMHTVFCPEIPYKIIFQSQWRNSKSYHKISQLQIVIFHKCKSRISFDAQETWRPIAKHPTPTEVSHKQGNHVTQRKAALRSTKAHLNTRKPIEEPIYLVKILDRIQLGVNFSSFSFCFSWIDWK